MTKEEMECYIKRLKENLFRVEEWLNSGNPLGLVDLEAGRLDLKSKIAQLEKELEKLKRVETDRAAQLGAHYQDYLRHYPVD